MKIIKSHLFIYAILLIALIVVSFTLLFPSLMSSKMILIHPSYVADFSDDKILMGASHNVFIGKIVEQVGGKALAKTPASQFKVEVIENIKGKLSGNITVNQQGGYRYETLYLIEGSDGLLAPGSTYLFATRYNAKEDWYTLNSHPNASKLLSSDINISKAELEKIIAQDNKVKILEAIYPNEQLLDADIVHANTRNNFTSLPSEEKSAAHARADAAKVALTGNIGAQ